METAIQAAMMADSWASRFFGSEPGEFLGLAWEAASRVAPQFSRRKAVLAIKDSVKLATRFRATTSAVRFGPLSGHESRPEETREPDRFDRLRWLRSVSGLTHMQAAALHGWAHDQPVIDEAHRLGVSRNRVNQLRHRAMERLGGVL